MQPSIDKAETPTVEESLESGELEEGVPLLPKSGKSPRSARTRTFSQHGRDFRSQGLRSYTRGLYADAPETIGTAHNGKMLLYDQDSLLTARSMMRIGLSALVQGPVLSTLAYCTTICMLVAAAVFCMPKASKLDTQKFDAFGTFLKIFIGFMLGTYVTQAFSRWWYSVSAFEKFLGSIHNLLFMLHTIRGHPDWRKMVQKYCVASGYILNAEVRDVHTVDKSRRVDMDKLFDWLTANKYLTEEESATLLAKVSPNNILVKTRAIWSWIGEMISHPVPEEGHVVPPPLLMRTIVLCQSSINEIEHLKMNIAVQMPFMYAQLLAILVHVNNTLLSVTSGMALGSAMNEIRRRSEQLSGERDTHLSQNSSMEQLYEAAQMVGIQILTVLLIPMVYVAFLHIAHMLCYPFGDQAYHLPTETFIARLHADLNQMSEHRAYFRQRHLEWQAMELAKKRKDKSDDEIEDDDDAD